MTPDQFWRMSFSEFLLFAKGQQIRRDEPGYYFREMFALTYNIHRGEKDNAISGPEVLPLSGDNPASRKAAKSGSTSAAEAMVKRLSDPKERAFMQKRFNSTPEEWAEYCKTDPYAIKRIAWEKKLIAKQQRQQQGKGQKTKQVEEEAEEEPEGNQPQNTYPEDSL